MPEFTLSLTTLAYGGDAIGRLPDGRAVFVPFALPGETVRIRLVEEKRHFARAELLEVIQASPGRIAPRCLHFGRCGGCHYQHVPYEAQLEAKTAILRDQLQRIGGLFEPPVMQAVPSPEPFNYRNHVQFHLTAEGRLGYVEAGRDRVFPIQECHLPEAPLNELWPLLDFEALPEIERIGLRLGLGDDMQLILESQALQPPEISIEELPISAVHLSPGGALVLAGNESVVLEVLGRPFRVSAGSFFQVNTLVAAAMVERVLEGLQESQALGPGKTVLEVYCGVGLFSAFLAPWVGRLVAIEESPSACEDFAVNLDEFENVELYESAAEDVLPHLGVRPDLVLVDPPRSGIAPPAMDALLALQAPWLVYVSCDPATLGRDARRLANGGYQLIRITPFDLFPQTYHIESISFWALEP